MQYVRSIKLRTLETNNLRGSVNDDGTPEPQKSLCCLVHMLTARGTRSRQQGHFISPNYPSAAFILISTLDNIQGHTGSEAPEQALLKYTFTQPAIFKSGQGSHTSGLMQRAHLGMKRNIKQKRENRKFEQETYFQSISMLNLFRKSLPCIYFVSYTVQVSWNVAEEKG